MRGFHYDAAGNACNHRRSSPPPSARRLRLEALEERRLLALVPELVADINVQDVTTGIDASQLVHVEDIIFFAGNDGVSGKELWKSNGTESGTVRVKDISPGVDGAGPLNLTNVEGVLFFTVGTQLWKSDGTEAGTTMVKALNSRGNIAPPSNLFAIGNSLYFTASDDVSGHELWKSDGTAAGTVRIKDINTGSRGAYPHYLTELGGTLFFVANITNGDFSLPQIWKSDGTSTGTIPIGELGSADQLARIGETLYFTDDIGRLWKSDGTVAGTVLVSWLNEEYGGRASDLTDVNGRLFFAADDGAHGKELWTSDGTAAGTRLVSDPAPGSYENYVCEEWEELPSDNCRWGYWETVNNSSEPKNLISYRGDLYYSANDGVNGRELWKSDGTAEGTVRVADINMGSGSSTPQSLIVVGEKLYFAANDGATGNELWKSDGTEAGTVRVKDTRPGSGGSNPASLANVGDTLFFACDGGELWTSDGTEAGTTRIRDIRPSTAAAEPRYLTHVAGTLYFTADDGVSGSELWKSNGTKVGTKQVKDIAPGATGSFPRNLTNVDDTLFFTVANELWKSDGTEGGTQRVKVLRSDGGNSKVQGMTAFDGVLYFSADDGVHGQELWKSDGTETGTSLVKDLNPGMHEEYVCDAYGEYECYDGHIETVSNTSYPNFYVPFQGLLFFSAMDSTHGRELWKTDGSAEGTVLVKDIQPGVGWGLQGVPIASRDALFFFADDGFRGRELWRSDGTNSGTVLLKDIRAGAEHGFHSYLTDVAGVLFFTVDDGVSGQELWKSDGTNAGTVRVKDIAPGGDSSSPRNLMNSNGTLFFTSSYSYANELWKSDGTAGGTSLVKDISPGGSDPRYLTNVRGTLFFAARDGVNGNELWESDGTVAGTVMADEIRMGSESAYPRGLTNAGGSLFFTADDGIHGRELWKVELEPDDTTPPVAQGLFSAGVPVESSDELHHVVSDLALALSEELATSGPGSITDPTHWSLSHQDIDASSQIASISFGLNAAAGRNEALVTFNPPLTEGGYVLTLRDTVTDLAGNALDGDADGQPGGDYSIPFSIRAPLPAGEEFRVNTFTSGDQRGFPNSPGMVGIAADSSFVVTWSSTNQEGTGDDVYFQRYDRQGNPLGGETRANAFTQASQRHSTIAVAADGSFVIAWNSDHMAANGYDIYARRFSAGGAPLGEEFLVNPASVAGVQRSPTVSATPDGRFAIAWNGPDASTNGIYARVYAANGGALTDELSVNSTTAGQQQVKAVALSAAGQVIVVWQSDGQDGDGGSIYARIYNLEGVALTGELLVNQTTTGNQLNPTVAVDQLGNFLVTWTSEGQDGDAGGIYARRFNAVGQPLADEFRVNEVTVGAQRYSTVAMDAEGDALITWSSQGQDGSGYGIYARRYNALGQPEAHEFRVNSFTAGNQVFSSPALDADGDFVVVWSSQVQDGSGYGVYGQRYVMPRPPQPGDADGDGDVDIGDLNAVRNNFGAAGPGILGDTNGDGAVDIADLNAVRNHFGEAAGSAAAVRLARNTFVDSDGLLDARWTLSTVRLPGALTASSADVLFTAIGAETGPAGAKPRRSPWGAP